MSEDDTESTIVRRAPAPAPAADPILHLLVLEGEAPQRIPLGPAPLRIGRVAGNGLVLPAPEVSRAHAEVTLVGDAVAVTDLGSTNGCFVDGLRISGRVPLTPGALLGIGPFTLRYLRGPRRQLERAAEMEKELDRASRYVQALLPPPIASGLVRTDWRFAPSASVGGDAFGYRWLDADRFAVYILDVAGHGADSALLAASVMNLLRDRAGPDLASGVAALNANFQMEDQGGLFFTLWYGVANLATRRLAYVAAGHHPGWLVCPGRAMQPLGQRNPPIGMMPAPKFRVAEAEIPPGSRLTLVSDGAFEITTAAGRQLGIDDFIPLLGPPGTPLEGEAERLLQAARANSPDGSFEDDVSILLLDFP